MTAEATAVKEITLTFNKAVADTTVAKITVKKGNATPTFTTTWSEDKKTAVLAMDAKMSKGTYDVTVSGLEKEDLTASVTVEDQKLVGFELLSKNLVADGLPVSYGTIKFRAVDQYGKPIKANNVTITSSFGTLGKLTYSSGVASFDKTAYPSNKVAVKDSEPFAASFEITPALAILGTKGTLTIVGENGATLSEEITLVEPAKAVKVDCLGLYNVDKAKYMDMTAGDKISNYRLALKFYDQYGTELSWDDVALGYVQATMATATTNINNGILQKDTTFKVGDQSVYGIKLTTSAGTITGANGIDAVKAGTMQITLVNTRAGLIDTLNFTVTEGTVIKSFSVAADTDIYAGEDNTLSYTALDADGNEVTKYDVLSKAFTYKASSGSETVSGLPGTVRWVKQKDGSAKLVFNPGANITSTAQNADTKAGYELVPLTFSAYPSQAGVIVNTITVKVNQARVLWEVTGIDSKKVTATAVSSAALEFKASDLKIADQYGNTLSADQIKGLVGTQKIDVTVKEGATDWTVGQTAAPSTTTVTVDDNEKIYVKYGDEDNTVASGKITFKVSATTPKHTDDGYDLVVSKVNAAKASDFEIEWTNGSTFSVKDDDVTLVKESQFKVVGKVGGKKVYIPSASYDIVSGEKMWCVSPSAIENKGKDRITKTGTLTVVVDDEDHNSNVIKAEYTYSNADPKLTKLSVADKTSYAFTDADESDNKITLDEIIAAAFEMKDQYNAPIANTKSPSDLVASITSENGAGSVVYNDTHNAYVVKDGDGHWPSKITVTLTCGDLTATKTISF